MNIISYIKINQVISKYVLLKEPFKYFLSHQDFLDIKAPKKKKLFCIYQRALLLYTRK